MLTRLDSDLYEFIFLKVTQGRRSDNLVPPHGGDAGTWSFDRQVVLRKHLPFLDGPSGNNAFSGNRPVF